MDRRNDLRSRIIVTLALAYTLWPGAELFGAGTGAATGGDAPPPPVAAHHDLQVTLEPAAHQLAATDRFTLVASPAAPELPPGFFLHTLLAVESVRAGGEPVAFVDPDPEVRYPGASGEVEGQVPRFVRLELPAAAAALPQEIEVTYAGRIFDPLAPPEQEYARSFETTSGLIDSAGVFLSGATEWVPEVPGTQVTFRLEVALPAGYRSVSQGTPGPAAAPGEGDGGGATATHTEIWSCDHPQEEIYLVAGRYQVTEQTHAGILLQTYIYEDDADLASRYLEATANYLDTYTELLGPYPYGKFAMVENFWQTGYGMPSFTLLGNQIIRMPWIIATSYGHEILHNWFGNGVYVVWERGNWCEGLTTYLADHLYKEQQEQGADYRRGTLRGYRDFVRSGNDFPLTDFRARHNAASQAVGYGKTMMVFHMLRHELGDDAFVAGLRKLVGDFMYRPADWNDLRGAFESAAGRDLGWFFAQWVERTGAPELSMGEPEGVQRAGRYTLRFDVRQQTGGEPYRLRVPVSVVLEGAAEPLVRALELRGASAVFDLETDLRPLAVAVDPTFDVFRRLDREEIPPALGELFGAARVLLVLPSQAPAALQDAWRALAESWAAGMEDAVIVTDAELASAAVDTAAAAGGAAAAVGGGAADAAGAAAASAARALPASYRDRAVWLCGLDNLAAPAFQAGLAAWGVSFGADSVRVGGRDFPLAGHSVVIVQPQPLNRELAWGLVATDLPQAVPGLARKLPHYRRYGYLVFEGDAPTNVHKGEWPAVGSPLVRALAGGAAADPSAVPLPAPLVEKKLSFSTEKLLAHVRRLAAPELEGRGIGSRGLDAAGDYIAAQLKLTGLLPGGDGGYFQSWQQRLGPHDEEVTLRNVIGILPGNNPAWQDQCLVVGAHYDHLGRGWPDVHAGDEGRIHPGADDNASGVAVLLELARVMAASPPPPRNVVFAFFTGEEEGRIGSQRFVGDPPYARDRTMAMINLDTVGRLGDGKLFVLGAGTTREMPHVIRGCGYVTGIPLETGAAAAAAASDQLSFEERGVPAVQLFTGPHLDYHRPTDTADKLDAGGMAKVATFAREAVQYLAAREEPLTWVAAAVGAGGEHGAAGGEHGEAGGESGAVGGSTGAAGGESGAVGGSTGAAGGESGVPGGNAGAPGGRRVALGTVPDFAYQGPGVRLDGTVPGSAAEAAGLAAGDIVIGLGDHPVQNLRDLSNALKAFEPGALTVVHYLHDGEDRAAKVKLAAR